LVALQAQREQPRFFQFKVIGMDIPAFFDDVPTVRVRDPLARLLGASADGVIEYRYADAVRLAGHSCPTVAGAFMTGRAALNALYPQTLPERGGVAVAMPAPAAEGTTGVVAQIFTLLTGAAGEGGFKGIGPRFARNGLLTFAAASEVPDDAIRFERLDTGAAVAVRFDARAVGVDAAQQQRMRAVVNDRADADQLRAFAEAWQERVRHLLLEHADDPATIELTHLSAGGSAA
jgi:hypothetical protein